VVLVVYQQLVDQVTKVVAVELGVIEILSLQKTQVELHQLKLLLMLLLDNNIQSQLEAVVRDQMMETQVLIMEQIVYSLVLVFQLLL
jgi:hypothetical protein|tara:strand:- start:296 stop:556 length:261 start_codon:yes stop_codon:yes gene_type:complete